MNPVSRIDMITAKVGKYSIPVNKWRFPTVAIFMSGKHGKRERGSFAFWTSVLKNRKYPKNRIIGRAYLSLNAGDRFDRINRERKYSKSIEDRKAYQKMWEVMGAGKNIKYIRPSTEKEVKKWASSHKEDYKYVTNLIVNGKSVRP